MVRHLAPGVSLLLLACAPASTPTEQQRQPAAAATTAAASPSARPRARAGVVRLAGHGFVDDDGSYLGVGASLFWAGWGYTHDRARLERNLQALADAGVDYIRVLGVVGSKGAACDDGVQRCDSWSDRTVTAAELLNTGTIAGLTDVAYDRYRLRVQWTIFGGIDTTPTAPEREALVRRFATVLAPRANKVQLWEVANEAWQNGFDGDSGRTEVRRYAQLLRTLTPNLVALTSPENTGEAARAWYDGSAATIITAHLARSTDGTGGVFGPIRAAGEMVDQRLAWTSNEPIGAQSSGAEDADPLRLALAAAYTWLCHGAGYVVHTGAGIRGGGLADVRRARAANLWESPRFAETMRAIGAVRKVLPVDLPNYAWFNGNVNFPGYPFDTGPIQDKANLLRAFAGIGGDRFVVIPIDVHRATPFTATRSMAFDVIDPRSGAIRSHQELGAGQTFTVEPTSGVVLKGLLLR